MAIKDWEYDGYGLYKYKPTGNSVRVNDVLELKYFDWIETTKQDGLLKVIQKEFDIKGSHDLPYYKKVVGDQPPEVAVRIYENLSQSREKKLNGYKVLIEDTKNRNLRKNLQNVLLNENLYLRDMLDEIDQLIFDEVEQTKESKTKKLKKKLKSIAATKSDFVYNKKQTLNDFKSLQEFLSGLYNKNIEMAKEFDLDVGAPLNEQKDAKAKKDKERIKFLKELEKQVPSSKDDAYTRRLLEEDKKMFDAFDRGVTKETKPLKGYYANYIGERTFEDDELNRKF